MGLLDAQRPDATRLREPREASRALEALVLKQLLQASGAFKGGEAAGSGLRADLFAEAIAEAVANAGGLGLGAQLEASLGPPAPPPPAPGAPGLAPAVLREPAAALPDLIAGPERLTSRFGPRADPFHGRPAAHHGIDLAAPEGSPILAAAEGVVVRAGERGGYGHTVELAHPDGLHTLYAHASELLVREGERVAQGQPIARVGSTGRSTGPHLHFEARREGVATDPQKALKAYAARAEEQGETAPRSRGGTL